MKMDQGDIINVYTSREEYEKLANKLSGFDIYDQKIDITLSGIKKSDGFFGRSIYYCDDLGLCEVGLFCKK